MRRSALPVLLVAALAVLACAAAAAAHPAAPVGATAPPGVIAPPGVTESAAQRGVTVRDLNAVSFATAKVGWAVGDRGVILKTTNGGRTWVKKSAAVIRKWSPDLNAVQATSVTTCWVVGSGWVLKTTNGGKTWTQKAKSRNPFAADYWEHCMFAGRVGWVVSEGGGIIKTKNGGKTWAWQSQGGMTVGGVGLADARHAWVSGSTGTGSWVTGTSDGGATWAPLSREGIAWWAIEGICAANPSNLWIATNNGSVFRSVDGGAGWILGHAGAWTGPFYEIATAGGSAVCAVGTNGDLTKGEAWCSGDGGATWAHASMGDPSASAPYPLNGVDLVTAKTGWVVGGHGSIYRTEDGGVTWQKQN